MIYTPGITAQSIDVAVYDDSGLPVTGLVAATFPAVTYSRAGANADQSVTLSDLATLTTAWSSGGLKERGNGVYRLDLPDAALASAGLVTVRGEATGKHLVSPRLEVGKVAASVDSADTTGLPLASDYTGARAAKLDNLDAAVSSRSTFAGGAVASVTGSVGSIAGVTFPANFAVLGIGATGHVLNVDTCTVNTDMRGTDGANTVAPPSESVIAAAVWDLATTGHTTAGTFGAAMNAAGSAGDPWATTLPGAYGAGTAGNILGTNLNAAVGGVPAAVWASGTRTLTAFAFTVSLDASQPTYAPAKAGDAMTLTSDYDAAKTANAVAPDNAGIAAIKAKTDALPADPAAVGSAMTLADGSIKETTIATPAEATGQPTGILGMIRRLFERSANKRDRNSSTGAYTLYGADNATAIETAVQSTTGSIDSISKAT
jgi:hypothetical protein